MDLDAFPTAEEPEIQIYEELKSKLVNDKLFAPLMPIIYFPFETLKSSLIYLYQVNNASG